MNSSGANFVSKGHTLQYLLQQFWGHEYEAAHYCDLDPKSQPLPLARIKKVMKSDREVKMISSEAPILFAKACEIFISEITIRAWQHAEENRRRTLQRSDVAAALARSDQFDFLIDLLPREDYVRPEPQSSQASAANQALNFSLSADSKFQSLLAASAHSAPLLVSPVVEAPVNFNQGSPQNISKEQAMNAISQAVNQNQAQGHNQNQQAPFSQQNPRSQ